MARIVRESWAATLWPDEAALGRRPMAQLSDDELERWMWTCLRLSKHSPGWWTRLQWRRRWRRAQETQRQRSATGVRQLSLDHEVSATAGR